MAKLKKYNINDIEVYLDIFTNDVVCKVRGKQINCFECVCKPLDCKAFKLYRSRCVKVVLE